VYEFSETTTHEGFWDLNRAIGELYEEYGPKYIDVIDERRGSLDADHQKVRDVALQELKCLLAGDD